MDRIRLSEGALKETKSPTGVSVPVHLLRELPGGDEADTDHARESAAGQLRESGKILCARCRCEISRSAWIAAIDPHSARRVVSNPAGVLFELLTVTDAWGVVLVGVPSTEFSWFDGTQWTVACCGGCGAHLGWYFAGTGHSTPVSFFGLIVSAVIEEPGASN